MTQAAEKLTVDEVVAELASLGSEATKRMHLKHGAREPLYGVKIEDLKKIQKRVKRDYELSLALYDTGISDAMYLAGLIADDMRMTKKDLQKWIKGADWHMIAEYTVAGTAAESRFGWELALEWIDSKKELIASAGWTTLSGLVAIKEDEELDLPKLKLLLKRVAKTIHTERNEVRSTMNAFVIAVGCYVQPLSAEARRVAEKIGVVEVDMGDTSCKVPYAPDYIQKVADRGTLGKKRKSAKC